MKRYAVYALTPAVPAPGGHTHSRHDTAEQAAVEAREMQRHEDAHWQATRRHTATPKQQYLVVELLNWTTYTTHFGEVVTGPLAWVEVESDTPWVCTSRPHSTIHTLTRALSRAQAALIVDAARPACDHDWHDYGDVTDSQGTRPLVACQTCGARKEDV